jgi:hypothetical protein
MLIMLRGDCCGAGEEAGYARQNSTFGNSRLPQTGSADLAAMLAEAEAMTDTRQAKVLRFFVSAISAALKDDERLLLLQVAPRDEVLLLQVAPRDEEALVVARRDEPVAGTTTTIKRASSQTASPTAKKQKATYQLAPPSKTAACEVQMSASKAVRKLSSSAQWAVERGCPPNCHSFLRNIHEKQRSKPFDNKPPTNVGFKHQPGCAIKYAVEKIRQAPSQEVADPGTFTYTPSKAIIGRSR